MQSAATGRPAQQRLRRILVMVVTTGFLLSVFVGGFVILPKLSTSQQETQTANLNLLPTVAAPEPASAMQANEPAAQSEGEAAILPEAEAENLVALVNGVAVDEEMLRIQTLADSAMASITGQTPAETYADRVARLINGELVWQQAQAAEGVVSLEQASSTLPALLENYGKDEPALDAALGEAGMSRSAFDEYFARLLTVDRYAAAEARALSIAPAAYLRSLQTEAQISYGPLADAENLEETVGVAEPVSTAPAETEQASADVPAQTESESSAPTEVDVQRGVAKGQAAPLFALPLLQPADAEMVTYDDLVGNPAVLSFWTTWCPYCRKQTPVLVDAYDRYAEQGLQIVGVNVKEGRGAVDQYVQESGIPYPIALDTEGSVANSYSVSGYPTTYFLDAEGRIAARHVGALTTEQVDRYVDLLAKYDN